jgi:hypothetical protein
MFNNEVVNARVNVLVSGANDTMLWWNHNINSPIILQNDQPVSNGVKRLKGYLIEEISSLPRVTIYDRLGDAIDSSSSLYSNQTAAIVRTDYLHAVSWSGGTRILLSMQIKEAWETIFKIINKHNGEFDNGIYHKEDF